VKNHQKSQLEASPAGLNHYFQQLIIRSDEGLTLETSAF